MSDDPSLRIIASRYRLTTLLGQGGMGSVWRAEHLTLGSEVAIKLIDPAYASNEEVRSRFVQEAKAAAALRSPHVVQILDYGLDGDTPYIAMELMEGESLADRLDRVSRLSPEDTSRIITEVARALSKAHEVGIVHRDLKPDNIFLVRNDDTEIAKVLDFGVAKQTLGTEEAHMTSTGTVLGTPYYMSPEQAEGLKHLDYRTDIWALAVIAYECLLGTRPFLSETLGGLMLAICTREKPVPSLVGAVPVGFDEWFAKGTDRDLTLRFHHVREAAAALQEVCGVPARITQASLEFVGATTQPAFTPPKAHLSTGGVSSSAVDFLRANAASTQVSKRKKQLMALAGVVIIGALGGVTIGLSKSDTETTPETANGAETATEGANDDSPVASPTAVPNTEPTKEKTGEKASASSLHDGQIEDTFDPPPGEPAETSAPPSSPPTRPVRPAAPSPNPAIAPKSTTAAQPKPAPKPATTAKPTTAPAAKPTLPAPKNNPIDLGI